MTDLTQLLRQTRDGDGEAQTDLLENAYADLKRLARRQLAGESRDFTLSATALVNEAYLRLLGEQVPDFNDSAHFFRVMAQAMRRIAVDHARARLSQKRGSGERAESLDEQTTATDEKATMIAEVNELLDSLEGSDPRLVQVVEHRFFMGLTESETADVMGVSRPTVSRLWKEAKEQLRTMLA